MHLEPLVIDDQCVSLAVMKGNQAEWVVSAIYAWPMAKFKEELWKYFKKVGNQINLPWLLIGDFN